MDFGATLELPSASLGENLGKLLFSPILPLLEYWVSNDLTLRMFASRISRASRPISNSAPRCLRRQRLEAMRRDPIFISQQMRQSRSISYGHGPQIMLADLRKPKNWAIAYKHDPITLAAAVAIAMLGIGAVLWSTTALYEKYFLGPKSKYPAAMEKHLRKALWYTNISLEPAKALKHYREALQVAEDLSLDPFTEEIMGLKIQVAEMFEKAQFFQKSINVLEIVNLDNLKWLDLLGNKQGNAPRRNRILKTTVRINIKLAELYSNKDVGEKSLAEERLVWAIQAIQKEKLRRDQEGEEPGEGKWISDEEQGAAFEATAHHFEAKDAHHLAAPLFLQAITLSPPKSCHTTILMNNLAISLAQQAPPLRPGHPPVSRTEYISNARSWANQAIKLAEKIPQADRNEDCDLGCAVATHNLGEFAEMDGNIAEAKKWFKKANALSKTIGFEEGIEKSKNGLARVAKR